MTIVANLSSILGALALLGVASSHGSESSRSELKPYNAEYRSVVSGFSFDLHRKLERRDQQYVLSMNMEKLFFSIDEQCTFRISESGVVEPISYSHIRGGVSRKHNTRLQFDWQKGQVTDLLIKNHQPVKVDFPSYDKLCYQPQFRLELLTKPLKQRYAYRLASHKRVKDYVFEYLGEERIATPLGNIPTLKFQRESGDGERKTIIWFAKDWDYLVARLEHYREPGAKPDRLLIQSASIEGRAVTARSSKPTQTNSKQSTVSEPGGEAGGLGMWACFVVTSARDGRGMGHGCPTERRNKPTCPCAEA